jgi:hypothetical protein
MTLRAAQAGKASLQAATGEELFDGAHHHGAERAATGFEAIFVSPDVAVEMVLKQAVESGILRMSGPIYRRRLSNLQVMKRRGGIGACSTPRRNEVHQRATAAYQWQRINLLRHDAAKDLTAGPAFEPTIFPGAWGMRPLDQVQRDHAGRRAAAKSRTRAARRYRFTFPCRHRPSAGRSRAGICRPVPSHYQDLHAVLARNLGRADFPAHAEQPLLHWEEPEVLWGQAP